MTHTTTAVEHSINTTTAVGQGNRRYTRHRIGSAIRNPVGRPFKYPTPSPNPNPNPNPNNNNNNNNNDDDVSEYTSNNGKHHRHSSSSSSSPRTSQGGSYLSGFMSKVYPVG